jgi:hypothetical protein
MPRVRQTLCGAHRSGIAVYDDFGGYGDTARGRSRLQGLNRADAAQKGLTVTCLFGVPIGCTWAWAGGGTYLLLNWHPDSVSTAVVASSTWRQASSNFPSSARGWRQVRHTEWYQQPQSTRLTRNEPKVGRRRRSHRGWVCNRE